MTAAGVRGGGSDQAGGGVRVHPGAQGFALWGRLHGRVRLLRQIRARAPGRYFRITRYDLICFRTGQWHAFAGSLYPYKCCG